MVPEKRFCFTPFYSSFFYISIPNVNWILDQFIPQFRNVIASNNDLLIYALNVIYFARKWWLNVRIWLPRTTENSTYFAQSLEIRGIESRLYLNVIIPLGAMKALTHLHSCTILPEHLLLAYGLEVIYFHNVCSLHQNRYSVYQAHRFR